MEMNNKTKNIIEEDGSIIIGDVRFVPVSEKDNLTALDCYRDAVTFDQKDENEMACYDIFNKERTEFLGYLNMFYNRGGYVNYVEFRQREDGNYEKRISALTAKKLLGVNFPEKRSEMTFALMEVANKLHKRNRTYGGSQSIGKVALPQRAGNPTKMKRLSNSVKVKN